MRLALELYSVETLAARGAPNEEVAALRKVWCAVRQQPCRKGEELAVTGSIWVTSEQLQTALRSPRIDL